MCGERKEEGEWEKEEITKSQIERGIELKNENEKCIELLNECKSIVALNIVNIHLKH